MIRFSKYFWFYAVISGFILIPGILSLILFGLRPAIDFTGGTVIELQFGQPMSEDRIYALARSQSISLARIQQTQQTSILHLKPMTERALVSFQKDIVANSACFDNRLYYRHFVVIMPCCS